MINPDSLARDFSPEQPDAASNSEAEASPVRQVPRPGSSPARTVLFVSEDDDFRHTTRAYLEDEGFRVRSCADAARLPALFFPRSGPGAAYSQGIDLLLIDVDALGATGLRLAAELASFEPDLPVIVLSSPGAPKAVLPGMKRRGWKFLKKPVRVPDLLEAIHSALASARGRQSAGEAAAARQAPGSPLLSLGVLKLRGADS